MFQARILLLLILSKGAWAAEFALSVSGDALAYANGRVAELYTVETAQAVRLPVSAKARFAWSANDLLLAEGPQQTTILTRAGKVVRTIANARDAQIASDGTAVSFVRNGSLWVASTRAGVPLRIAGGSSAIVAGVADTAFAEAFGVGAQHWWSPGSDGLAYVETQYPKGWRGAVPGATLPTLRLNVYDVRTHKTRTVATSDAEWPYILRAAWSPTGALLYYRMNRLQNRALLVLDEGEAQRTVLEERDDYWLNAPETPVFVGDQVVVSSERTHHKHLYLYSLEGKLVRDLTPGLDVYRLHNTSDAGAVYVSAASGDMQQQQLFRIDTTTPTTVQMTTEVGWHDVTVSRNGRAYVDAFSTANAPAILRWMSSGGVREIERRRTLSKVTSEYVGIRIHNATLPARVLKPSDFDAGKRYPVIVQPSNGPGTEPTLRAVRDAWGAAAMGDDARTEWNRQMAARGFVIVLVDTRGTGGYSHLFEEPVHYQFGAQEVADLREVYAYLAQQPWVDKMRVGIWGRGFSGQTALHAAFAFPNGFAAVYADAPTLDWRSANAYFAERYLGLPAARKQEYDSSSPIEESEAGEKQLLTAKVAIVFRTANNADHRQLQRGMEDPKVAARVRTLVATATQSLREVTSFFERELLYRK
jgi:dipeptidyl-peptidase 4